ncbi:hypothetical protein Q5H92_23710 [Hymenobacter sp. M29]|uniref:DUF4384 domain-containing protein n=1 Tax=Hymenobacter mellowenesis TaxID=3063995 RepID=A0ABT9AHS1_9BACT|nr:hypothetical protein [Hymenobacter sp. M29]MDO7849391.1 hypothetical protein [Hymenobacter sp. M29]
MSKALVCLLLATTWLTTPLLGVAQAAKTIPTAAELKKNLAIIEASTEGESEEIDQLLTKTTRQLVAYLGAHAVSAAAAKDLGLDLTVGPADAASVRVYTFSYSSGGTRGTIHRPVVQWKTAAGQLRAYALREECFFNEIHPLPVAGRIFYLLLGMEQGDSQCYNSEAFVFELKGNYLLLPSAFGKTSALLLCNAPMAYEAGKQTLRIDFDDDELIIDDKDRLAISGYRRKPGAKRLRLQLSGGSFRQQP